MTDRTALISLRDKVEAGTARPYEIEEAALAVWSEDLEGSRRWEVVSSVLKGYQSSIDAAVALLEAVLPGTAWTVDWSGWASVDTAHGLFDVSADTPALALLLATLDARIEETNDD